MKVKLILMSTLNLSGRLLLVLSVVAPTILLSTVAMAESVKIEPSTRSPITNSAREVRREVIQQGQRQFSRPLTQKNERTQVSEETQRQGGLRLTPVEKKGITTIVGATCG